MLLTIVMEEIDDVETTITETTIDIEEEVAAEEVSAEVTFPTVPSSAADATIDKTMGINPSQVLPLPRERGPR